MGLCCVTVVLEVSPQSESNVGPEATPDLTNLSTYPTGLCNLRNVARFEFP